MEKKIILFLLFSLFLPVSTLAITLELPYGNVYSQNETVFVNGTASPNIQITLYYNKTPDNFIPFENVTPNENGYYELYWYNETKGTFTLTSGKILNVEENGNYGYLNATAYYQTGTSCLTADDSGWNEFPTSGWNVRSGDWYTDNWGDCTDCDYYAKILLNITSFSKVKIQIASDDGQWLWVNGVYVGHCGANCHAGGTCTKEWDISSYLSEGSNEIRIWCSEHDGAEYCKFKLYAEFLSNSETVELVSPIKSIEDKSPETWFYPDKHENEYSYYTHLLNITVNESIKNIT